jgi:hypothetical protein
LPVLGDDAEFLAIAGDGGGEHRIEQLRASRLGSQEQGGEDGAGVVFVSHQQAVALT